MPRADLGRTGARAGRDAWLAVAAVLGGADESFANALVGDRRACGFLDGLFGNGPALGRWLAREPTQLRAMASELGPNAAFANAIWRRYRVPRTFPMAVAPFSNGSRSAKRRALLTVALADISGAWPLDKVAESLTRFADAAIACALDQLLAEAGGARHSRPRGSRSTGIDVRA